MLNLKIDIKAKTFHDLALALEEIKRLVEEEYVMGFDPKFEIAGEEEIDEEEETDEESND